MSAEGEHGDFLCSPFIESLDLTMKTESTDAVLATPDLRLQDPLRAVIFDYGGVLTYLPTDRDWETMASIAGAQFPRCLKRTGSIDTLMRSADTIPKGTGDWSPVIAA